MKRNDFCQLLEQTTYPVEGFDEGEKFTSGSAVAFNNRGDLLTAAHVVTNRLPVRNEDVNDPNCTWIAKTKSGRYYEYKPLICGFNVQNDYLREPLTVDLAIMRCLEQRTDVAHLPLGVKEGIRLGDEVLMAGFPDEMELPFKFDKVLDYSHPEIRDHRGALLKTLDISRRLLMMKAGMIGNIIGFQFTMKGNRLEGEIFYVDNVMHSGDSGGPVINERGEITGIITLRAVTDASTGKITDIEVPSGSTVAVTTRTIAPAIEKVV